MVQSVLSLRSRALLFLSALVMLSGTGVFLLWDSQARLNLASNQIQEVLLPAGRLIEQARTEIDLQIQELTLLHRESQPNLGTNAVSPQQVARLRLTPGVRSLLSLQSSQTFPAILVPLFRPWADLAESYEAQAPQMRTLADALPPLRDLRQKTVLLHRAIDRELSVQLLTVTQVGREHLMWGFAGLLIAILGGGVFVYLLRTWMAPLERLTRWLGHGVDDARALSAAGAPLPPSVVGRGILAPPAEVQSFVESLRGLVQKLRISSQELDSRDQKTAENERAIGTMFSAIQSLLRHNEKLLSELIKKERLASMGEMAAQLAHEIRNPLNSLNLKLELLREELDEKAREQLDRVLVEIDRLDALTESHLRTTRSVLQGSDAEAAAPATGACRVADAIDAVVDTLRPELDRRGIFVQRMVRDPELRASCPANVLKAAIMNLVKNAAEACEGSENKVVRLRADSSADAWSLAVADSGRGFPEELLRGEFESFRTDKPGGSGLGLVTSRKMLVPYGIELQLKRGEEPFRSEAVLSGPLEERASKATPTASSVLNSGENA